MNFILNIIDNLKWKAQDFIWMIQDKIALSKEFKMIDAELNDVEELEIKPKKKKNAKKKNSRKK